MHYYTLHKSFQCTWLDNVNSGFWFFFFFGPLLIQVCSVKGTRPLLPGLPSFMQKWLNPKRIWFEMWILEGFLRLSAPPFQQCLRIGSRLSASMQRHQSLFYRAGEGFQSQRSQFSIYFSCLTGRRSQIWAWRGCHQFYTEQVWHCSRVCTKDRRNIEQD